MLLMSLQSVTKEECSCECESEIWKEGAGAWLGVTLGSSDQAFREGVYGLRWAVKKLYFPFSARWEMGEPGREEAHISSTLWRGS